MSDPTEHTAEKDAPDSWARRHARENPGHRAQEGRDDPGSCRDCRERSPIYDLAAPGDTVNGRLVR